MTASPATSPATSPASTPLRAALADLGLDVLDTRAAREFTSGRAVVVLDDWTLELATTLSRHALDHPVALVPVRHDGAVSVVGPVLRPGAVGCVACTEYRRLATIGGRVPWHSPGLRLAGGPAPALADGIAALAAALLGDVPTRGAGATVGIVHSGRATWSTHAFRPVGGCPVCLPLPGDVVEPARFPQEPRPTPPAEPSSLRGPNDRTHTAGLRAELYDERFGPIHQVTRTEDSAHSLTSAYVTLGRAQRDGGYGRALDFEGSERVALFEGIERLTGMSPHGRRTVLRSSYAELGPERAVDPVRLGLPDPAHHGHPASSTVPYAPDLELDWVHGWSLTHERPVAVPEHVAYWDPAPGRPRVVYESSSGCAVGNSPEEAALYGLFEVAERDAFLMAWYARTPLRRIALPDDDLEVLHLVDRAETVGYRLTLLDATNDFGVPAIIALARHEDVDSAAPQVFLAAGAHHDPRAAIRSAVVEAVTNVFNAAQRLRAEPDVHDPGRLRPMLEQPDLVRTLADHTALYGLREARPRVDLLDGGGPQVPWQEVWPGAPEPVADLTVLLEATVRRLARAGLEVLVVGQDEAGLRKRLGLYGAKAIVPGALPMTFGHVNRRTLGLPRLLEVPYLLGRAPRPARHGELVLHPHPFP
ncbi:TOMM precursor leader peptide-binding protein [Streptomyces sp. RerS4]|uniref:TOMM precursor leader peptide-binding protein n=1 Tax=Streptomyces sp. RerS4 TaxID=2942449 RepID=UPI00201C8B6C|nr:TOMM precursor leader peptide-binding protein [Streptomyces sp. RerS4]UQW99546.1 TOMM precursor leader peptide-binding protein [Streptomyces sp. RerS4]